MAWLNYCRTHIQTSDFSESSSNSLNRSIVVVAVADLSVMNVRVVLQALEHFLPLLRNETFRFGR